MLLDALQSALVDNFHIMHAYDQCDRPITPMYGETRLEAIDRDLMCRGYAVDRIAQLQCEIAAVSPFAFLA